MANEFMQAAKMAYGFAGTTQKILWFLCDEISATQRQKYLKRRIGFVVRSYDLIAFRCACNRSSITQAIKTLTAAKVLRAIKKGPHRYFLFCIYLDRLIALRREWEDEKRILEFRKTLPNCDKEDIAEEEAMWAAEAREEEKMEIASWSPSRVNSELQTNIGSANGKSVANVDKPLQRLAQPMATVEKAMSSAENPMSRVRKGNVWNSKKVAEATDSNGPPQVTENPYGGYLSGVLSRGVEAYIAVPEGPLPSINQILKDNNQDNSQYQDQTSGPKVPNPLDGEIPSPVTLKEKQFVPPPRPSLCRHGKPPGDICTICGAVSTGEKCAVHEKWHFHCKECFPMGHNPKLKEIDAQKEAQRLRGLFTVGVPPAIEKGLKRG